MGLPGTSIGNVSDPTVAGIKMVADEFIDAVEMTARVRRIARGAVPILRPANFAILADAQWIHIVYTGTGAGGIAAINITDLAQRGLAASLLGSDALRLVEQDLGYRDCEVVTLDRSLIDTVPGKRSIELLDAAGKYLTDTQVAAQELQAIQEARALLAIPTDAAGTGLLAGVRAAVADVPAAESVFVMMRYRESPNYDAIERAIVSQLQVHGLTARLARNKAYSDDLWENVRIYMHASTYGIAVFEEIDERSFNPNVAMELGYMYAIGRRVLLLKDQRMPVLPTDIMGRIYRPFDTYKIALTVKKQIQAWADNDLRLKRQ